MHPADAPLQAAIAAAPDAALPRLVYADFLDDHDFPHHAASLRLDAALAAETPWADRYWQLLTDRRQHTPADGWPGDLGWLADRQPLLCGVPDDWRSRWRAVRAFVSRWWNAPLGDIGRWGEAVAEAERAAGRELPPSVREWVAFSIEVAGLDEEAFRDPLGVGVLPDGDAVYLLEQAEGDLFWVMGDDPTDPAVTLYRDDTGDGFAPADQYADGVAGFALLYLLSYRADQRPVDDYSDRRAGCAADSRAAGRFDLADVFESPGQASVLLPPFTWGHALAQLLLLAR